MSKISTAPQIQNPKIVNEKYKNVPKPYLDVAEGMESQFTNHLLNEMRKTVHSSTPESSASRVYKSLLDQERADMMAKSDSGVGVKDVVLEQILPAHLKPSNKLVNQAYKQNLNSHRGGSNE